MQAVDLDLHVPHLFLHMRSLGGQGEAAEETEKVDEGPVKDADGWEEPFRGLKRLGGSETILSQKKMTQLRFWMLGLSWDSPFQEPPCERWELI